MAKTEKTSKKGLESKEKKSQKTEKTEPTEHKHVHTKEHSTDHEHNHKEHKEAEHKHEHAKKHESTEPSKHHKQVKEKTGQKFDWVEYKPSEIEEAIVELANSGHSPSEIGMILRDQYGIPNLKKFSNQTVSEILAKHKLLTEIPEDLLNLIRQSVKLDKHLKQNKKDMTAKRGLQLTVSKIRRLTAYYHKNKKLPKDWNYTPETAALLTK